MDSGLVGVLGTALGAIIGAIGASFAQRRALEQARLHWMGEQRIAEARQLRSDLSRAISAFVLAAERAQNAADNDVEAIYKLEVSADMWATAKQVALLGTSALKDAAYSYADDLRKGLWRITDQPTWMRALESNRAFMAAAEAEVDLLDSEVRRALG